MTIVLAIDQSTSATKAMLFDESGHRLDGESREHEQHYPQPGWVEHDVEEIWQNFLAATKDLLARNPQHCDNLACLSITNQRETIVVFDRDSGRPLYPAIVWQCRRSTDICEQHNRAGHGPLIHSRTGLILDAYFSGSKLQWLVENQPGLAEKLASGDALIGTMDAYLVYRLTGGSVFATDSTNASRTLLFDIDRLQWDEELCELFAVPVTALPEVRESKSHFGETTMDGLLNAPLPIVGVMGDSQAALFAQRCFEPGMAKATFGTGSSMLLNIGSGFRLSEHGVVTALAWVRDGEPVYAFEGIIINSAATLKWLQNQLGFVANVSEIEALANETEDSGGVYLVPAFSGLGFPHWAPNARGAIVGLSDFSDRRHLARAAIDSIAYQLRDALDAMQAESGIALQALKADGGPTANRMLMQFTADITQTELAVPAAPECSALGAVLMGLLGIGEIESLQTIAAADQDEQVFQPAMSQTESDVLHKGWQHAVQQVLAGAAVQNSPEDR
jgi:glycerol kinase